MARTILIPDARCYYSTHDEDVFFGWLYSLPGFISVIGKPEGLYLTLKSFNKEVILELIALLFRYKVDMSCLSKLCNSNNEKWLKDRRSFWYKPIFEKQPKAKLQMQKYKPDKTKMFALLTEAAGKGDPYSAYALATWYLRGEYVVKDYSKAVELLELAAQKKNPSALHDLAFSYEKGLGVKKNDKKAYELYLQAALWGHKQAIKEVGRCLHIGIGVLRDTHFAEIWQDRAKALGLGI